MLSALLRQPYQMALFAGQRQAVSYVLLVNLTFTISRLPFLHP
jgi:hypothetical protein